MKRRVRLGVLSMVGVLGLWSVVSSGAESEYPSPTLALVLWGSNGMSFQSLSMGTPMRLRVTGPDYTYEQTEGSLRFVATEADGTSLPDGTYRYELREIVTSAEIELIEQERDPEAQQALKRQLRREGRWPPPRPETQGTVFRIEGGLVIAPD